MENIEAMLCAYVEGDLDATGKAQIEKHLQDHPQHRKLLGELMAMREMVRGLPRAKAPMDVGDSLRQKVERSMLLEDSPALAPMRQRAERWPQFFGIAAIFLLASSLCFIVYKALGPTLRPAVFTENSSVKMPDMSSSEQMAAPAINAQPPGEAAQQAIVSGQQQVGIAQPQAGIAQSRGGMIQSLAGIARQQAVTVQPPVMLPAATPPPVQNTMGPAAIDKGAIAQAKQQNPVVPSQRQLKSQAQTQILAATPVDMEAIQKRLASSGYGVYRQSGGLGGGGGLGGNGGSAGPVLMVVNSTDVPATKAQMIQFLSSSAGVSWNAVGAEPQLETKSTTMPSADIAEYQLAQLHVDVEKGLPGQLDDAAKEPWSDLYVARGLTPERADALRQLLTAPQNGSAVQVSVQPADALATTQPSVGSNKDEAASPPVQTANGANLGAGVAGGAVATSAAGRPGGDQIGNGASNGMLMDNKATTPLGANQGQALPPVDAVIVLQTAAVAVNPAAPTTQPAGPAPAVMGATMSPSPATRP